MKRIGWGVRLWCVWSCCTLWMGCATGEALDAGRDVPFVPVDAPRLDTPPDTPPPVCEGTAEPCSGTTECAPGCYQRGCTGSPRPCSRYFDAFECRARDGCEWRSFDSLCDGAPFVCPHHTDRDACVSNGCEWNSSPPCEGSPTPCSLLDAATCASAPGCRPVGNDAGIVEDAGVDAPTDTPPAPLCTPVGDCDPFVPSTCPGAANGCFASSFPTRCGPLASSPRALGATCTFDNDCQRGLACIVTGTSSVCTRICRAGSTDDCSDPDTVCGLPLGESDSCLRSCMEACDLYEQDCPSGEACVRFSPAAGDPAIFACLPAGTTPVGGTCMFANSCVRGAACIGSTCRQLCRDSSDCASGTCQDSATPGVRGCF